MHGAAFGMCVYSATSSSKINPAACAETGWIGREAYRLQIIVSAINEFANEIIRSSVDIDLYAPYFSLGKEFPSKATYWNSMWSQS